MATTYVGFYSSTSSDVVGPALRADGVPPREFLGKVNGFPASLPSTCNMIGSWPITGGEVVGVMVVEVESYADLHHINNYYAGWLNYDWHPTTSAVDRNQ